MSFTESHQLSIKKNYCRTAGVSSFRGNWSTFLWRRHVAFPSRHAVLAIVLFFPLLCSLVCQFSEGYIIIKTRIQNRNLDIILRNNYQYFSLSTLDLKCLKCLTLILNFRKIKNIFAVFLKERLLKQLTIIERLAT